MEWCAGRTVSRSLARIQEDCEFLYLPGWGLLHRLRGSLSVILPLTLLAALYSLASAARSSLSNIKIAHIYAQPHYVDLLTRHEWPQKRSSRLSGGDLCTILNPNFYEKAVFVKGDVATAPGLRQLLCALRAMLLSALSGSSHSLWWLGA